MADPYVIFPGTAGNFVSTDDVNLLDADTANLQQSIGQWTTAAGMASFEQSQVLTPKFGDYHCKATTSVETNGLIWWGVGYRAASAGQEWSFGVWAAASIAPTAWTLNLRFYDAANASLGNNTINPAVTVAADEWQWIEHTATAPANTAWVTARWGFGSGATIGSDLYWDAACLVLGDDPTFTPSLRIVGTLYEEIEPADMPIVFAGDGTPLTVGDGWAGNGYHYRRYDGPDNTAPIVASFEAEDIQL